MTMPIKPIKPIKNRPLLEQQQEGLLPNFCGVKPIFILSVGAQLLVFVLILATGDDLSESWDELGLLSFFVQWVTMSSALFLCLLKRQLGKLSAIWAAVFSYLVILFVTGVFAHLAQLFMMTFDYQWGTSPNARDDFLLRCLLISSIISLVLLRYLYILQQWKQQITLESEARIQALQSRIRPHFLFNSMNIIASLIHSQPNEAERAVEDLSELFRATLKETSSLILLVQEWALCEHYLHIEGLRLGKRLKVTSNLTQVPKDALIPMLSLQPLIENAIYHGIQPLPEGGEITVEAVLVENMIQIHLSNPMPPTSDKRHASHTKGNKMALENIEHRLALLFGQAASLKLTPKDNQFDVVITIPYMKP